MIDRVILFPYYLALKLRDRYYSKGGKRVRGAEVPTICVGNVTAGGTGKTPHTEMILRMLLQSDEWAYKNIAVLSRGYLRESRGFQQVTADGSASMFGDEPVQIKKKFPQVMVAVDKDRIEGCDFLCHPEELQTSKKARRCWYKDLPAADLIVLDDAFQYRKLKASLNIVLVDYYRPVFKDKLLPLGHLRDLPERVCDADVVIITKCPVVLDPWERTAAAAGIGVKDYDPATCSGTNRKGRKQTILFSCINYGQLQGVYDTADNRYIYAKNLILFSGIAKDTPLRQFLSQDYKIVDRFRFSDHHKYNWADFSKIQAAVRKHYTAVVATTEKDAQRVLDYSGLPDVIKERLFMLPIEVGFLSEHEEDMFRRRLLAVK